MKKLKVRNKLIKYDNGDKYIFINGVATVPGMQRTTTHTHIGLVSGPFSITNHHPIKITIKEFNELKEASK